MGGELMRHYLPRDLEAVNQWRAARKVEPLPFEPRTAYVVPGVAFGALILTDSGIAFIDGYTTNPAASSEERREALEAITLELVGAARRAKVSRLYALTSSSSIAHRALWGGGRLLGKQWVYGMALD